MSGNLRIGIDLGGTKIEGLVLAPDGRQLERQRIAAPRGSYWETISAIRGIVQSLETACGPASVGIGMPGSVSRTTGLVQNANSTWLNGQSIDRDLEDALGRPVRLANDANCFALSEAIDGAGVGALVVLGIIIGTGCGGGIVIEKRLLDGARGIGGEWGHNPLPWSNDAEHPGPACWCGRRGCMEAWVSGPALAADHERMTGERLASEAIAEKARLGNLDAVATLERHASRLARGLAHVVNIIDPDVIVLGGGLSHLDHLYESLPRLIVPYVFADKTCVDIHRPKWGAAGGVRGAAWLWGEGGTEPGGHSSPNR
ncbi:MAG: ROK family protein [Hyphomicrobium sp.]